jgi:hypothetical protein
VREVPYYNDRYVDPAENVFYISDWKESIENTKPGGADSFSLESGEATLVAKVPWLKTRSFITKTIGWSYADQIAPFRLRRINPLRHPWYPWLTATTVSFDAVGPVGVSGVGTKIDGPFPGAFNQIQKIGKYNTALATVRFTDKPWTFLEDDQATTPAAEAQRNTYFDPVPSIEIISAEGINNIAFANGPAEVINKPVPAPFGTLMAKTTYTLNWMYVPHEYISGSDPLQFRPTRLEACTGRVNSAAFMGFAAMTLLMQPPQYTRFRFPVLTAAGGVTGYFGWNIRIPLQYFNPTLGVPADAATYAGHQTVPRREDLLWYGAKRAVTADKLYPEADFNNIFKHVDAP